MSNFNWITSDDVVRFHNKLINQFGGKEGVREIALLEMAVSRPKNFIAYALDSRVSVHFLASLYVDSIVNGCPFFDGNERTGLVVGLLFLEINGYEFHATDRRTTDALRKLISNNIDHVEFSKFLEENSTKR